MIWFIIYISLKRWVYDINQILLNYFSRLSRKLSLLSTLFFIVNWSFEWKKIKIFKTSLSLKISYAFFSHRALTSSDTFCYYSANYNVDGFILINMLKKLPIWNYIKKYDISLFVRVYACVCMCVNKYIRAMMYCILRHSGFY